MEKAKKFDPPITEFILVTTASRDAKIQKTAHLLTQELSKTDRPIPVYAWGWEDIEENASKYPDAWKAFDPTFDPFVERAYDKTNTKIDSLAQKIEELNAKIQLNSSSPSDVKIEDTDENTPLHGKVSAFQTIINTGLAKIALEQLEKLKADSWPEASRTERYRMLVAMASAHWRLGDQNQAGILLLDAFNECPEHKSASTNQAKGYLLTDNSKQTSICTRNILKDDEDNADAAGLLIQALIQDMDCQNPLSEISEPLHERAEVLTAQIHFLRCRDNPGWIGLAHDAVKKHPDDELLQLFAAEASLVLVTQNDRDVIAGGSFKTIDAGEFHKAAEILYKAARDHIDKGCMLLLSAANNAALALRLINNVERANEILDSVLCKHPEAEDIRFQRAIIAYLENDFEAAREFLPAQPTDHRLIALRADICISLKRTDEAIDLLDNVDEHNLPPEFISEFAVSRALAYTGCDENENAIAVIKRRIKEDPASFALKTVYVRLFRLMGRWNEANEKFIEALEFVDEKTGLAARLELAFEGYRLDRADDVVALLIDRVSYNRDSEALRLLISPAINGNLYRSAKEVLDSLSPKLYEKDWVQRFDAIFSVNTGDRSADSKIAKYLKTDTTDLEMILVRIAIWQRSNREIDIQRLLNRLDMSTLVGTPYNQIRLASLIVQYDSPERGIDFGYSVLMDNWGDHKAHLAYQGLILLSSKNESLIPESQTVCNGVVVSLESDRNERRYRIEQERYKSFGDEHLDPDDDLAKILSGKKIGDEITLQERIGAIHVTIKWIKHVYLDAYHLSIEDFNQRFPRADGIMKFKFDTSAEDPMGEMREVVKSHAESDQRILDVYKENGLPLSFVASFVGQNAIEAWQGLHGVGRDFQVCRGIPPERTDAFRTLQEFGPKGCVVDAITLSIIRRLKIQDSITSVCGPINTTQSVIGLLAERSLEADHNRGKKMGFLSCRNNNLVFEEYSEEIIDNIADERREEFDWARDNVSIVAAVPQIDLNPDTRKIVGLFDRYVTDPAIAAQGNDLLLLSDDMDYRVWAQGTLNIKTCWVHAALMVADRFNLVSTQDYCEAVNLMALSGHDYISLNVDCLMHQACKDEFTISKDLTRLLEAVGGPTADLESNSKVLAEFLDALKREKIDELKIKRIMSEGFRTMSAGRTEGIEFIVGKIIRLMKNRSRQENIHALGWLMGHSIGSPNFKELVSRVQKLS